MTRKVAREPQPVTTKEFLSRDLGLPERVELVRGVIGPYSDEGKLTLLANWGAADIVRLTGSEVWLKAIAACEERNGE